MSSTSLPGRLRRDSIGTMLLEAGLVTQDRLADCLAVASKDQRRVEHVLVEQGLVDNRQMALFLGLRYGIPYVNLKRCPIQPEAIELIPESAARRHVAVPLSTADGTLVVAIEDPTDIEALDALAAVSRKTIQPVVSTPADIQAAIRNNYRSGHEIERHLSQVPVSSVDQEMLDAKSSAEAIADAPVVRAIDLLIRQAIKDRASDIHIEPQEDMLRVRYRIDGILHETLSLPLNVHPSLVSRLKIMGGMNIAERRRPQDGQIAFPYEGREVDIRVASANTVNGEMIVMRILDKGFALMTLPELGFLPEALKQYEQMLKMPFGMILTSGPTGSGKTTTLYASMNQLDSMGRNIITIEDPVEYRFRNINQMQVRPEAGVSFAAGLRACMRLDPDIILVGEIRDAETARIAVQAALTGHLVLSSVHANDTSGALFRLMDLDAEPFLVAQAVIGVVAQRMVRRICPYCAQMAPATPEERLAYEREMGEDCPEFLYGSGCNFCANTGYLGRMGIYEVMPVSETISRMVLSNARGDEIRAQAIEDGMISLWRSGMTMVKKGYTTPREVLRNVISSA